MRYGKHMRFILPGMFLALAAAGNALAHDVIHDIHQGDAVILKIGYDSGEAMTYAEVKIYSPENEKIEFQNGRTDAEGSFAFLPDTPGEWRIVVNDGNGHGLATTFTVDQKMNIQITQSIFNRVRKLVAGVILLIGFTGIMYFIRARAILSAASTPKNV